MFGPARNPQTVLLLQTRTTAEAETKVRIIYICHIFIITIQQLKFYRVKHPVKVMCG